MTLVIHRSRVGVPRDRLYASYVSRDALTGDALAPSSVVQELLHAIARAYVTDPSALRRRHPVFSRRRFLQGDTATEEGLQEIIWLSPDGREMNHTEWHLPFARCLGLYLAGAAIERRDRRGRLVTDNNFVVLCNAHHGEIPFRLPEPLAEKVWWTVLDTAADAAFAQRRLERGTHYPLQGRSLALLRETAYR